MLMLPWVEGRPPAYLAYCVKRICRIYLPYCAAIAGAALLALLLAGSANVPGASDWVNHMTWSNPVTPAMLVDHGLMIGHYNTLNGVIHSLIWEMRVSLLFPLLALPLVRWKAWGALGACAVLLAFIVLMVNFYAFKHYKRFDYSRDHKFTLSERTRSFLKSLNKPIKVIVFMVPQDPLQSDVANLAENYRAANPKFISIENVDPFRNVGRAGEVQAKYKLAQQENVVIVDCEGRNKIITDEKMAEVDNSGAMMGQPPQITAFTGEQAVTAALIEVTEGKKSSVYYVQGHGEPGVGKGQPLAVVGSELDNEHLTSTELNLQNVDAIPADASVVMILGARYDFSEREVKLLSDYWDKGGRLLLLLNPDAPTPHLAAFLDKLGIKPDDDRVLRTLELAGGVTGVVRDAYGEFVGESAITKQLTGVNLVLLGATQSLTLEPERVAPTNVKLAPLVQALKGFWGETEYKDIENTGVAFDQGKDKAAPLAIAATVEKNALGDQRVQNGASRMIVVGNAKFVENDAMSQEADAFFIGSLNWLLEREALIGIPPRQVKNFSLNLPDDQMRLILGTMVFALPTCAAVIGILVWWMRRR